MAGSRCDRTLLDEQPMPPLANYEDLCQHGGCGDTGGCEGG